MIHKIIEELFKEQPYSLTKFNKGLTNQNYILNVNNDTYVVRIPYPDQHFINRKQEEIVSQLVTSLDSETIYFNSDTGIKITKYIEDAKDYEICCDSDKIERCAHLVKALHKLPCVDFNFDSYKQLQTYKSRVNTPLYDLSDYEYAIEHIQHKPYVATLCHNDLVHGNILYTKNKDYLIDYEYASNNDPLFDVISFLGENQIFDNTLRERFYHVYFEDKDIPYEELEIMEVFQNVLWCYWAMMMYEIHHEDIYKDIAKDKYEALIKQHK